MAKTIYIIAGCNGAGKTTASYTLLPDILNCKEFVNADEIAKGLSPFQPEKVSFEAGRIMLRRINELLDTNKTFAFETTLATKSYKNYIKIAKKKGYQITLLFFWLNTQNLAISRVKNRVLEGGHHIPEHIIRRRYERRLYNFFNIYLPLLDNWLIINNSGEPYQIIAEGSCNELEIFKPNTWKKLKKNYHG